MSEAENTRYDGVSITLKHGKGYDDTWTVFHGTVESVKDQIEAYFGMDKGAYETLSELVLEATSLIHGSNAVRTGAGGRSVKKDEKGTDEDKSEPAQEEEKKADSPLLERVNDATAIPELQKLWAANKEAFNDDADLMAAWKAKGKALKGS